MPLHNQTEDETSLNRPTPQIPKTLTMSNAMSSGVKPLRKLPRLMPAKEEPDFKSGLDLVHSPEHVARYDAKHRDIGAPYSDKGMQYDTRRLLTGAGADQAKMLNMQNQGIQNNYASGEQAFFKEGDAALPPLNPKAPPLMDNNPMPAVNLAETATQMPGYTSPQQTSQLREQKAAQPNLPYLPEQPALENGVPSFDDRYMKQNYSGLNRQANESRYMKNFQDAQNQDAASAAMVNRINRGTAAIKDLNEYKSGTGQYAPQQGSGLPFVGRRPDKAPKSHEPRSTFTNDSDFNKRHGAKLAKGDAALMNANTNRQRLGNTKAIAENRDQVDRERIFAQAAQAQDRNQQAINKAQSAAQQQLYSNNMRAKEYQQRDAIAKNKLGQGKRLPRYNESTDSMGNTISEYGGYFDEGTGQFVPPGASIDKYGNVVVKKTN